MGWRRLNTELANQLGRGQHFREDPIEKQRTSFLKRSLRLFFMREQGLPTAINQLTYTSH
jgi:hypothetical protein